MKDIILWRFLKNIKNDKYLFVHTVRKIIYTNYVELAFHRERDKGMQGGRGTRAA